MARRQSVPTRVLSPFEIIEANEPAFAHWLREHRYDEVECALRAVARDGRLYEGELGREGTGAHGARLSKREMELRRAIDYFNQANRSVHEWTAEEIERQRYWFQRACDGNPDLADYRPLTLDQLLGREPAPPPKVLARTPQEDEADVADRRRAAQAEVKADPAVAEAYITAAQLDERWGLQPGTAERMTSFKEMPGVRAAGALRFRPSDVEDIEARLSRGECLPRFEVSQGSRARAERILAALKERAGEKA